MVPQGVLHLDIMKMLYCELHRPVAFLVLYDWVRATRILQVVADLGGARQLLHCAPDVQNCPVEKSDIRTAISCR